MHISWMYEWKEIIKKWMNDKIGKDFGEHLVCVSLFFFFFFFTVVETQSYRAELVPTEWLMY